MAKWMYTDMVERVACPRCHQSAGSDCRQPKGRKQWPPHDERCAALRALPDFNMADYEVKALSVTDVMAKILGGNPL